MNKKKRFTVTVDGYSSCGKSTFAKAIAAELGYLYIDSGAMYRAVTLFCVREGLTAGGIADSKAILDSLTNINIGFALDGSTLQYETLLNGERVEREIRDRAVSDNVSAIAAIAGVRVKMVELQRGIGSGGGVVMDGRDIGTVVFPDAEIKIFMTAAPEIRAQRRYLELIEKGMPADLHEIERNVNERDRIDGSRAASPLRMAPDAILLDNSHMTMEEQMVWFRKLYNDKLDEGSN
jgi:cytidylate kinase